MTEEPDDTYFGQDGREWITYKPSRPSPRGYEYRRPKLMSMNTTTAIVGSRFHKGADEQLAAMDRSSEFAISLVREPGNSHDKNAVAVYSAGVHLGYVPRQDAAVVAQVMDAGIRVRAWYKGKRQMKIWWPASTQADLDKVYERAMG